MKNEGMPIDNFEYAADCLDPKTILESMRSGEIKAEVPRSNKKRFSTKEFFSDDVCTLIILILILYSIVNGIVAGETDYV